MSELRKEPISRRWVIAAPERRMEHEETLSSAEKQICPFCKGNEHLTPDEISRIDSSAGKAGEWDIRIVPDKNALLKEATSMGKYGKGMYDVMNPKGAHQIVVETPDHDKTWWDFDMSRMKKLFGIYRDVSAGFKNDSSAKHVIIVKNHGVHTSNYSHSHSHILSLPFIIKRVDDEMRSVIEYFQMKERCIYCDIIVEELGVGERILFENDSVIVFAPFASRFPYELCIIPKNHEADYTTIKDSEIECLAEAFLFTFKRLKAALKNPSFSIVLHSSPFFKTYREEYHWHWEIKPQTDDMAGFEWGTGLYINSITPEEAIKRLKNVML